MTNLRRPSLLQARELHSHARSSSTSSSSSSLSSHRLGHVHEHHHHQQHEHEHEHEHDHEHEHHHHHENQYPNDLVLNPIRRGDSDDSDDDNPLRSRAAPPAAEDLDDDLDPAAPAPSTTSDLVTHVVQAVKLIQVVDPDGAPLSVQTSYGPPNTIVLDSVSGKTVAISFPNTPTTLAGPGSSGLVPSYLLPAVDTTPTQAPTTSAPPAASAPPSAPFPTFPTLGDARNITNSYSSHNATAQLFVASKNATTSTAISTSFSTSTTSFLTSSTTSESSSSSTAHSTSLSDSILPTAAAYDPLPTGGALNGGAGDGSVGGAPQPTSSSSSGSDDGNLTPQQKQMIGGIVGGCTGAAVFGLLLLLLIRYKRRWGNRPALGAIQSGPASRGLPRIVIEPEGGDGGDGDGGDNGSGGAMAERYSPAAITAALTSLTTKRSSTTASSGDTGEKGFYRVSGRKLPSVLQVGGDGYSDPRASVMSGMSDYYRGSQCFEPVDGGATRLALGTPMRPVSGVPIMRSGPAARVAVMEQNPFVDPPSTPSGDDPAPSLGSRDSPRGAGSRFQEGI